MTDMFIPKNADGVRIFYTGIENLVKVEEDLLIYLARPEVNLSHVLNIDGGVDLQPVEPIDAYERRANPIDFAPFPNDDRRISEYEKKIEAWSKDCAKALAIVKSIYSLSISTELRSHFPRAQYNNGSRENIIAIMNRVRTRHGGYSVPKSDLSRARFEAIPKITTAGSVTSILLELRYEIGLRESWSDLYNNIDYRFTEAEKKSRLVSLMNSWDELTITS